MPLVAAEPQLLFFIQHHDLYGGGANIDTNTIHGISLPFSICIYAKAALRATIFPKVLLYNKSPPHTREKM